MRWIKIGNISIGRDNKHFKYKSRIAIFNFNVLFDHKYKLLSKKTLDKIKKMVAKRSIIIVNDTKFEEKSKRAITKLNLNCMAFVNSVNNGYTLPNTQLWNAIKGIFKKNKTQIKGSFYCGKRSGIKNESHVDRAFAYNAGIKFISVTHFMGSKNNYRNKLEWAWKDDIPFSKRERLLQDRKYPDVIKELKKFPRNPYYMVLIIGESFTGKKEIAKKIKTGWPYGKVVITRNYYQCLKAFSEQKSVIMMGEFGSEERRKTYIDLITKHMIPIIIVETAGIYEERKMLYYVRRQKDVSTNKIEFRPKKFYDNYSMPERDIIPNKRVHKAISHMIPLSDEPEYWFHY